MKKLILTLLIAVVALVNVQSLKADDFSDAIVKSKKKLKEAADKNDGKALLKVRGDFERILQLKKNEWLVNYYLAVCDFWMTYTLMDMTDPTKTDNKQIQKYTESALDLLNKSTDSKEDFAEAWGLKLGVQSNRWMYEPGKMNDIIAKMSEATDMCKKYDPENPRYLLIEAINTYYTPEAFGGGVDKALPMLEKSYKSFETYKPMDETYPNWGKETAAGMIALCYSKQDKKDEAKKWYDKALEINPDSGFIKNYIKSEMEKK
ncbi:MAG: tetratricopeptide repeat protein [Saprospiraceae bacterium]